MPYKDKLLYKDKINAAARASYRRNSKAIGIINRAAKTKNLAKWREYVSKLSCTQCGQSHPATFDFHHVIRGPGTRKVNVLLKNNAFKAVYEEIKNCVLLCANRHRILHYEERQNKKKQVDKG